MAKIKTGFSTYGDLSLLIEASRIITSITGNTYFPNPVPPLSEVKDAYDLFDTAMSAIGNGNKDATMVKNKTRAALERVLGELALYVQLQSKNDEIMLLSTGFRIASKPAPIGVLPKPINFTATPAEAQGSNKLSMKPIY